MTDPLVSQYLPDKDQCTTDYPERDFFFGILATLKNDYLTEIVDHANLVRYNQGMNDQTKDYIQANDQWIHELTSHPFISSKIIQTNPYRKTWKGNLPDEAEEQTTQDQV